MRAILIDDEKPALLHLERLLLADGRIHVTGRFTSAQSGLDYLAIEKTDIVFLDIGMPEMNGLEAAEHIQQLDNDIRIIFVTAYNNYAIEAFELHAMDYLLKPIIPQRFVKTLDRIRAHALKLNNQTDTSRIHKLEVRCFKQFEIHDGTGARRNFKWRTTKAQELFILLLHHKGEWIDKDYLLETIWPEYGQDNAVTYLHTSVYQIRKLLKEWGVETTIEFAAGRYRLNYEHVLTDVDQFEQGIAVEILDGEQYWETEDRLLALYRGDYLAEHDYGWANLRRMKLQQQFEKSVIKIVKYEMKTGRELAAIQRLYGLQEKEPYSEEICRLILTAYVQIKDFSALHIHYQTFAKLLISELGVEPDNQTKECYAHSIKTGILISNNELMNESARGERMIE